MAENREKYAQVILDISARGLDRPFTYRVYLQDPGCPG